MVVVVVVVVAPYIVEVVQQDLQAIEVEVELEKLFPHYVQYEDDV